MLSRKFFPLNDGALFIEVVKDGKTEVIDADDPRPLYDGTTANLWELAAYATKGTTHNDMPVMSRPLYR